MSNVQDEEGSIADCSDKLVTVPEDVEQELVKFKLKTQANSGGMSSIFKSASQFLNSSNSIAPSCSFAELKKFSHMKLSEWLTYFESYFKTWPVSVNFKSEKISVSSVEKLRELLSSESSIYADLEAEFVIWLLSYILNTTIGVLSYNLQSGQGADGSSCMWRYYQGRGAVPPHERYSCSSYKCLYLLQYNLEDFVWLVEIGSHPNEETPYNVSEAVGLSNEADPEPSKPGPEKKKKSDFKSGKVPSQRSKQNPRAKRHFEDISGEPIAVNAEPFIVIDVIKDVKDRAVATKSDRYHAFRIKKATIDDVLVLEGPCSTGLINLGNTCYLNTVIQCLSNTHPLAQYFLSGKHEEDMNTKSETGGFVAIEFAKVLKNL